MPAIAVDLRMLHAGGIGTYLRNLVPLVISARPDVEFYLLGDPDELSVFGDRVPGQNVSLVPCGAPIYSVAEQLELPRIIPKSTDLFWSPHYNIPLLYRGRLLVTIHDLLHLALPRYVGGPHKRLYARGMFEAVCRGADAVMCDSDFTARELARLTGRRCRETFTVHLGVDDSWFRVPRRQSPHPKPFLLYVGNVKPHKNLKTLIEAFREIQDKIPHDLLIVGKKDGFITDDREAAAKAEVLGSRVRLTGYVEDDLLKRYLAHADALVLPSFYEGFGLPPLEAMACGCPAIVSEVASLPEVCADAALYCDPRSASDVADKMLRLVSDEGLRGTLRERGLERARRFGWDNCAERTLGVIENVLRSKPA